MYMSISRRRNELQHSDGSLAVQSERITMSNFLELGNRALDRHDPRFPAISS